MSNILQPVIDRLRAAGPGAWERIAAEAGVAKTLPRKLVYGDRANPGVLTIQPLIDFFDAVDRGEIVVHKRPELATQKEVAHG